MVEDITGFRAFACIAAHCTYVWCRRATFRSIWSMGASLNNTSSATARRSARVACAAIIFRAVTSSIPGRARTRASWVASLQSTSKQTVRVAAASCRLRPTTARLAQRRLHPRRRVWPRSSLIAVRIIGCSSFQASCAAQHRKRHERACGPVERSIRGNSLRAERFAQCRDGRTTSACQLMGNRIGVNQARAMIREHRTRSLTCRCQRHR